MTRGSPCSATGWPGPPAARSPPPSSWAARSAATGSPSRPPCARGLPTPWSSRPTPRSGSSPVSRSASPPPKRSSPWPCSPSAASAPTRPAATGRSPSIRPPEPQRPTANGGGDAARTKREGATPRMLGRGEPTGAAPPAPPMMASAQSRGPQGSAPSLRCGYACAPVLTLRSLRSLRPLTPLAHRLPGWPRRCWLTAAPLVASGDSRPHGSHHQPLPPIPANHQLDPRNGNVRRPHFTAPSPVTSDGVTGPSAVTCPLEVSHEQSRDLRALRRPGGP